MKSLVNYQEIEKAYNRISYYATKTPLLSSDLLNKEISSNIFIKAENLQKTKQLLSLHLEILELP